MLLCMPLESPVVRVEAIRPQSFTYYTMICRKKIKKNKVFKQNPEFDFA